jgi:dolichol-phosphate hexosyltransferase
VSASPLRPPDPAGPIDATKFRGALAVVILPTLNEEEGLARTLRDLPFDRFGEPGHRIQTLVIDGGSTDRTLEVAREWNIPVLHQTSRGKGGAMLEAVAWVHRLGIPFVVVLDADATYPADRILPALALLQRGTDLVIGVRRPVWGPPSDLKDLVHRVGNLAMSFSASLFTHRPILDLCSGFWGVSTERFMDLRLKDTSFAIEAELVLKSIRRGYTVHQIPVDYHERVGQAKLRALRDGSRILRTIFQEAVASRRTASKPPAASPWGPSLLLTGLVLGRPGPGSERDKSHLATPGPVAPFLQLKEPPARFDGGVPEELDAPPAPLPEPPTPPTDLNPRSPFFVSLPAGGSSLVQARSVSLGTGPRSRTLSIEFLSDPMAILGEPAGAGSVRLVADAPSRRTRYASLLVLTSRLNFEPQRQQQVLLAANGFQGFEERRDALELSGGLAYAQP